MNIAESFVESYIYADMFNREYQGGSDVPEKIHVGGVPVEHIIPSLKKENQPDSIQQEGGNPDASTSGPLANKVVPVGLVVIQTPKILYYEHEKSVYTGENREVVSESLYDLLIGAVLKNSSETKKPRYSTPKRITTRNKSKKQKSK